MAKNSNNPKNNQSALFKQLTRLLSGPLINYRTQTSRKLRRVQLDKFKFQSAGGLSFKKSAYNPFEQLSTAIMANQLRAERYQDFDKKVPLIAVPSTYNNITEKELNDKGVNIVIYANHLLRSAYPSMVETAKSILENKRSYEVNDKCLPIKQILELIPND